MWKRPTRRTLWGPDLSGDRTLVDHHRVRAEEAPQVPDHCLEEGSVCAVVLTNLDLLDVLHRVIELFPKTHDNESIESIHDSYTPIIQTRSSIKSDDDNANSCTYLVAWLFDTGRSSSLPQAWATYPFQACKSDALTAFARSLTSPIGFTGLGGRLPSVGPGFGGKVVATSVFVPEPIGHLNGTCSFHEGGIEGIDSDEGRKYTTNTNIQARPTKSAIRNGRLSVSPRQPNMTDYFGLRLPFASLLSLDRLC